MRTLFLLLAAGLLFTGCRKEQLTASGDKTEETRSLKNFTGVRSSGSKNIHVKYGDEFQVTLKGSANLLPYFKTEVLGGTLSIGYERVNVQHDDVEVFVTLPSLVYTSISGSGSISISGNFPLVNRFEASISGSGKVDVENTFETQKAIVDISGSGNANLQQLVSRQAEISISGSGDARITARELLKVQISGSGKAYYWGTPLVDSHISGSGSIIKQ